MNDSLIDKFGYSSYGIYLKFWREGINAKDINNAKEFYIGHDLNESIYDQIISVFKEFGFSPYPEKYDPKKSIVIRMI